MIRLANSAVARMGRSANGCDSPKSHAITRGKGDHLGKLALLALLALCACGRPDRLVIDDDPELVDATMTALVDLEHEADCKLFKRIDVGGSKRDWRGKLPTFGTVTVQVDPSKIIEGKAGRHTPSKSGARGRVYVPDSTPSRTVVAHELLHSLGLGHQPREARELMSPRGHWAFGRELMEQIHARCVDGPAGP